jgi:glycyl-tRNA synthetase alpha chain
VAERTAYIDRIRNLARASAEGYLNQRREMGFPLMAAS